LHRRYDGFPVAGRGLERKRFRESERRLFEGARVGRLSVDVEHFGIVNRTVGPNGELQKHLGRPPVGFVGIGSLRAEA
jgi:hypothetical protein